jgi:hypothetical protein
MKIKKALYKLWLKKKRAFRALFSDKQISIYFMHLTYISQTLLLSNLYQCFADTGEP